MLQKIRMTWIIDCSICKDIRTEVAPYDILKPRYLNLTFVKENAHNNAYFSLNSDCQ